MRNLDIRKVLGTVIGGTLFLVFVLFLTYAWYQWRSNNTNINIVKITDTIQIEFVEGSDVNATNIGPILDFTKDGVIATFKVINSSDESGQFGVHLNISSISNTLLVDSFKFVLVRRNITDSEDTFYDYTNLSAEGNFSNFSVGNNLISTSESVPGNSTYEYQFIVYIDGNMSNNTNMQNNSLTSNLIITDGGNYLAQVKAGSWVKYTGNNGCSGKACEGQNANYVSDTNMGYCSNSSSKYTVNGWRVAYSKNSSAYLVSAGALECICSSTSTVSTSCSTYVSDASKHIQNLNKRSLNYCNTLYAYGDTCNGNSVWNIGEDDFQFMVGNTLSFCYGKSSNSVCGYGNDLISNGGYYWYSSYDGTSEYIRTWSVNGVGSNRSNIAYGLRPIIRLDTDVVVTGGKGTYSDPYIIGVE